MEFFITLHKFLDYEQGLRASEIKRISKGMRDKGGYWYKNETLIKRLDIRIAEQKHLKTIIGTEVKYDRRRAKDNKAKKEKRRNKDRLTKKQKEMQILKIKVLELREQGLSLRKIAEKIDITLSKVQRCIK